MEEQEGNSSQTNKSNQGGQTHVVDTVKEWI